VCVVFGLRLRSGDIYDSEAEAFVRKSESESERGPTERTKNSRAAAAAAAARPLPATRQRPISTPDEHSARSKRIFIRGLKLEVKE
jgi:hypothetical protein